MATGIDARIAFTHDHRIVFTHGNGTKIPATRASCALAAHAPQRVVPELHPGRTSLQLSNALQRSTSTSPVKPCHASACKYILECPPRCQPCDTAGGIAAGTELVASGFTACMSDLWGRMLLSVSCCHHIGGDPQRRAHYQSPDIPPKARILDVHHTLCMWSRSPSCQQDMQCPLQDLPQYIQVQFAVQIRAHHAYGLHAGHPGYMTTPACCGGPPMSLEVCIMRLGRCKRLWLRPACLRCGTWGG